MKAKTAIFLILIGLFIWLLNLGVFSFWKWGRDWPWIIIIIGVISLIEYLTRKFRTREKFKKEKTKEIIEKLEKGEISVNEAIEKIKKQK